MSYHEALGLSQSSFENLEEYLEARSYEGLDYRHLPGYRSALERGTVLVDGAVVRGFPKVPRTLVLETGIPRYFDGEFAAEEKLDGYNTRIVRLDDGRTLAFTRSGMVCPFTTHVVTERFDLALDAFFDDHPEQMLCGEMIGPENPYTTHDYPDVDSLAFRAFDIRDRTSGTPMPVRERRARCETYGFPQVPLHGYFDPDDGINVLYDLVRTLDDEDREGLVMKSLDVDQQLKYTTAAANQGDLAYAFSVPFDYGQDFMFRRLIREAFQAVEWDEDETAVDERARGIGEAILRPMVASIRSVEAGETVGERHTVRAAPVAVERLLDHLRDQNLRLEIDADREEDGDRVVTFEKVMRSSTDKTQAYLDGRIVRE